MSRQKQYGTDAERQAARRARLREEKVEEPEEVDQEPEPSPAARQAVSAALRQSAALTERDRERMRREYGPYYMPRQKPLTGAECDAFWALMQQMGQGRRLGQAKD